jgi:ubiquinol-cytochrome c reductase cytochrome c1 subunit
VLWELQGWQAVAEEKPAAEGEHGGHHGPAYELVQPGALTPVDYEKWVGDLVTFMAYAAEPGKQDRQSLGVKVIAYLLLLLVLVYFLKKEFWKDIH